MNHDTSSSGLLRNQWAHYGEAHNDLKNIMIHLITVPIFMGGGVLVVLAPLASAWLALGGLAAMFVAMAAQGRGHRFEARAPSPFRGPLDVVVRIFAEQWITFPRYVLSGALRRALRAR